MSGMKYLELFRVASTSIMDGWAEDAAVATEPQLQLWSDDTQGLLLTDPQLASGEPAVLGRTGNNNNNNNSGSQEFGHNVPTVLYGNATRFGMLKGSIAARKATAAARAASKSTLGQSQLGGSNSITRQTNTSQPSTCLESPNDNHLTEAPPFPPPEDLLGPMGSFKELPRVSSAADLIRTASHDRSSHSVSQARGLRLANVPAAYSEVERTGYYRPSDRIGRLYTKTAAALTSTSAQSVAKAATTLAVASGAPASSGGGGVFGGARTRRGGSWNDWHREGAGD